MFQLVCDPSGVVVKTALEELVPAVIKWGNKLDHILRVLLSHALSSAQVCLFLMIISLCSCIWFELSFFNIIPWIFSVLSTSFGGWRLCRVTFTCPGGTRALEYWCVFENAVGVASIHAPEGSWSLPFFFSNRVEGYSVLHLISWIVFEVISSDLFCIPLLVSWWK